MAPAVSGSRISRLSVNIWFRYLVPRLLSDSARLVKEAITAKKVALKCEGALLAIHASMGIIATWPSGDSSAVSTIVMKRAYTNPLVRPEVHSCSP